MWFLVFHQRTRGLLLREFLAFEPYAYESWPAICYQPCLTLCSWLPEGEQRDSKRTSPSKRKYLGWWVPHDPRLRIIELIMKALVRGRLQAKWWSRQCHSPCHLLVLYHFIIGEKIENWSERVKSLSHVRLCDPMDCSLPGSSIHGILQARVLEWVAISFSNRELNCGLIVQFVSYRQTADGF